MLQSFLAELHSRGSVTFAVRARPGAAKTRATEMMDDESIKIDIAAPAENGKANKELLKFLAQEFEVGIDQVSIVSGATARAKLVRIRNVSP